MLAGAASILDDQSVQHMMQAMIVTFGLTDGFRPLSREDVEQELQEVIFRQWLRWDGSVKFTTYLYPRLRGACLEYGRRFGAHNKRGVPRLTVMSLDAPIVLNGSPGAIPMSRIEDAALADADEEITGVQEIVDLEIALRSMPSRMRLALLLLFYEGLSERDAAERLGTSLNGCRALRDAGLTKCRLALLGQTS